MTSQKRNIWSYVIHAYRYKILENIAEHSDINHSKILYDPPPRVMEIKTKINKWDLIKIKSFCIVKEPINKVKKQLSEEEKKK